MGRGSPLVPQSQLAGRQLTAQAAEHLHAAHVDEVRLQEKGVANQLRMGLIGLETCR